jgi:hypothetical protein
MLKRASDEIDVFSIPGFSNDIPEGPRGDIAQLMLIYRFLVGLSFENLLKGLLITQGIVAGKDGKLDGNFKTHSLTGLIKRVDTTRFKISRHEKSLLKDLEKFISWAGRYPIPLDSCDYTIALGYSDREHKMEAELWERIVSYIKVFISTSETV